MLTDEGLHVYRSTGLGARYIEFVPWDHESFIDNVTTLIVKKCNKKPVVILNDMVEQHYRKEKVPKTSIMDKAAVVKRRLGMAFPNYPIRAALKLKGNDKGVPAGTSTYLFASIPQSEAYKKTIEAVSRSGAPIVGLYLLPIEGTAMVKALAQKQSKKSKTRSVWTIFIGQHHGGGLRQIVTKGGELALTRMTPIVDTDVEENVWVKDIASELQSTMSYLARFGYKQKDGLDIFVISNENTQNILDDSVDIPSNLYCLNAAEAGALLGMKIGQQEDLRYADALYATFIGKQRKFVLPMQNRSMEKITKPRQIASLVMVALVASVAYFSYDAFRAWNDYALKSDELQGLIQRRDSLQQEYKDLLQEKSMGGAYDFFLVNNTIEVYNKLTVNEDDPLLIMRALGKHLGPNLRAEKVDIKSVDAPLSNPFDDGYGDEEGEQDKVKDTLLEAMVTLSFSSSVETEVAVNKVTDIAAQLKAELVDFDVIIDRQVGGVSYSEAFAEELGGTQENQNENKTAIIVMKERPVKQIEQNTEEF